MNLIKKAEEHARYWHGSQMYGSVSFVDGHLIPVSTLAGTMSGGNPILIAIGWLHDILEDTLCSHREIRETFGHRIYTAVVDMTRNEDEDYKTYMGNTDSALVKFAESACNFASSVQDGSPDWRRIAKYARDIAMLEKFIR
jgi:(p)ppGpp synthase/HD superfamily hydrolase